MRGLFWLYALAYPSVHPPTRPAAALRIATHACDDSPPANRLRQLKKRMREGFYRRPEVLDEVARTLTDDIIEATRDGEPVPPAPPSTPADPSE